MRYEKYFEILANNWVLFAAVLTALVHLCVGLGYMADTDGKLWITILEALGIVLVGIVQRAHAYGPRTYNRLKGGRRPKR